jgi:thiol-disulfide isomerase/thioredoxin
MKKETCLLLLFLLSSCLLFAQPSNGTKVAVKARLDETSVVRDASGNQYAYEDWKKMLQSGEYNIKRNKNDKDEVTYLISRMTAEEKDLLIANASRPKESPYFTNGEKFHPFKTKDMYGKKINLKELAGKIVVINFWFVNCGPCRKEIPDLNELVKSYSKDSSTVFLAIALDDSYDLKNFLVQMPFDYTIIDSGRNLADRYGIKTYPTNVVIDKEGIVRFHSHGYSIATAKWIKKTIEEAKGVN